MNGVASGLYIAGTGSFSAEVADWARAAGLEIAGLIALRDPEQAGTDVQGLPVVALEATPPGGRAVLGLGGDRAAHWARLEKAGWAPASVVHPSAVVAASALVAASATIGPLAAVGAEAEVGQHAILSRGVLVGHHSKVGDFATLNPGANVGGNSRIGEGAFLGMGCVVVNGTSVGVGATVAAGAVSLGDVGAEDRVQGVPARLYSG